MAVTLGRQNFDAEHASPPQALVNRTATVQLDAVNTIRYPGDPFERRDSVWLQPGSEVNPPTGARGREQSHPIREGNHARFLLDGVSTMGAIETALNACAGAGDFIYMLNWWADPSLILPSGERLGDLLARLAAAGVQIRGMYFRSFDGLLLDPVQRDLETIFTPWIPRDRFGIEEQSEEMVRLLNTGFARVEETLFDPGGEEILLPTEISLRDKRVGAGIHDSRLVKVRISISGVPTDISVGSHHQKICVVKAKGALTAFEGGIDFNRDRLEPVRMTFHGAPLVDTHCQVTGPVAGDLLATFLARWTDHPESAALDRAAGKLIATAADTVQPADPDGGRLIVQLGRTFGGRDLLGGGPPRYAFAPQGEATARKLIRHAIQQAKRFIYIEDQYFVSMEASQLLRETLAKNKLAHITIVLPHHDIGDMPLMCERRRAAIKNLKADSPEKVRIFHRSFPGQPTDFDKDNRVGGLNTYVHSKLIIIDDEFASIGSVNFNRRSWTHDSEATLAIYDPASDAILTSRFVRWLRIRIWANQLFGVPRDRRPNPPGKAPREIDRLYAELHDGVAAGALWNGLIQLRDDAFRKSPPDKKQKDGGFDQAQTIGDLVAQEALVRPYDEDDPPLEVFGGDVLFLGPIVGVKKAAVQALTGLDPDAFFDTIVDPST